MKSLRPLLSAVFGLALLVQGLAVAAAPYALAAHAAAAQESAPAEMPCHETTQHPAGSHACCGSDCPDMTSCALGHLAAAPAVRMQLAPVHSTVVAAPARSAESVPPSSRLRPPIVLHA